MGVAGCGKSSVGVRLAEILELTFVDGDDYHSEASIRKMTEGVPLSDEDRLPWLRRLNRLMRESSNSLVISCSALRRKYREILSETVNVRFVFLDIQPETALQRVRQRDHFFAPSLIDSQFSTLETPDETEALCCNGEQPLQELVGQIAHGIADERLIKAGEH